MCLVSSLAFIHGHLGFLKQLCHLLTTFVLSLQDLENFIAKFGETGFVLVIFGSVVSKYQTQEDLKEMNMAFARLSQGVIWKCKHSLWPKDVKLASNVKIMDWLPQNDLLGKGCSGLLISFH